MTFLGCIPDLPLNLSCRRFQKSSSHFHKEDTGKGSILRMMNRRIVAYVALPILLLFAEPSSFAQSWACTGTLNHDRQFHTATLLQNGKASSREALTTMAKQWLWPNYMIPAPEHSPT